MSLSDLWFSSSLDRAEAKIISKGVPLCYWGYIAANGAPGTADHDGLGAIYNSREDFIDFLLDANPGMALTVVDGRDLKTIREWIGGEDWTTEEEEQWKQLMKCVK